MPDEDARFAAQPLAMTGALDAEAGSAGIPVTASFAALFVGAGGRRRTLVLLGESGIRPDPRVLDRSGLITSREFGLLAEVEAARAGRWLFLRTGSSSGLGGGGGGWLHALPD